MRRKVKKWGKGESEGIINSFNVFFYKGEQKSGGS